MNLLMNVFKGMSEVQTQIGTFFITSVIILLNFPTAWKSPPLSSGPRILTLRIPSSWQMTLITLPCSQDSSPGINPAVTGGIHFDYVIHQRNHMLRP